MGFTYLDKFTYLNTFVIQVAQKCLDNGGPTVIYRGECPTPIYPCRRAYHKVVMKYFQVFPFIFV